MAVYGGGGRIIGYDAEGNPIYIDDNGAPGGDDPNTPNDPSDGPTWTGRGGGRKPRPKPPIKTPPIKPIIPPIRPPQTPPPHTPVIQGPTERPVHKPVVLGPTSPPVRRSDRFTPKTINGGGSLVTGGSASVVSGGVLGKLYGKSRVDGQFFFQQIGDVTAADFAVAWGSAPYAGISSIDRVFINDADFGGNPNVTYSHYLGSYTQGVEGWLSSLGYLSRYPGTVWSRIHVNGVGVTPQWRSNFGSGGLDKAAAELSGAKLVEPRENMIAQSENFALSQFSVNVAPTLVTTVGDPFGGTAATEWLGAATGFDCYQRFSQADQGAALTGSVWLRAPFATNLTLFVGRFNTGTFSGQSVNIIIPVTTAWTRYSLTVPALNPTGAGRDAVIQFRCLDNGTRVQFYGMQLEAFPVSRGYIKTTGVPILARENLLATSESYAWGSDYVAPTLATGVADPFGTLLAGRWTFGAAPNDVYRASSLPLAVGEPMTFSAWLRVAAGTVNLSLQTGANAAGAFTATPVTVTTTWTRFSVTQPPVPNAASAFAWIVNIPSSTVLEVFGAQLEKAPIMGPYLSTDAAYSGGGVAISRPYLYSTNPALAIREFLLDPVNGCGAALSQIDEVSFGNAAAYCDEPVNGLPRWSVNGAFNAQTTADQILAQLLTTCDAELYMEKGKYKILCHQLAGASVLALNTATNCASVEYVPVSSRDIATRVTVKFQNQIKGWTQDQVRADHPLLATGGVEMREVLLDLTGVKSETQAARIAVRTLNRHLLNLKVVVVASFSGILLTRGSLFTFTTSDGLAAQGFTVLDYERLPSGEYKITGLQYAASLYAETTITVDTPPSTSFPPPAFVAPEVSLIRQFSASFPGAFRLRWDVPRGKNALVQYGASFWTVTNGGTVTLANINDGLTVAAAFDYTAAADTTVTFDAGVGVTKRFIKLAETFTATVPASWPTPFVEYSDDNSSWFSASSTFWRYIWIAGVNRGFEFEWADVGAHRYWRRRKGSSSTFSVYTAELQWTEWDGVAWTDQQIDRYEIHARNTVGQCTAADPIIMIIPGNARPTVNSFLDFSAFTFRTGLVDPTYIYDYLKICVITILPGGIPSGTTNGLRSTGINYDGGALI